MKVIFAAVIALSLVTTVALYFLANRVDYLRRVKGWNGTKFGKSEYSTSKKQSRFIRTTCFVLLGVAGLAAYGYFVFG
jgi:uncharacterized membrane protein YjgN (DUF898 family)